MPVSATISQNFWKIIPPKKTKNSKLFHNKYGIVKPDSFRFDSKSNNYFFTMTNFKDEIDITYRGKTSVNFKEGDNVVLTGYLPNPANKTKVLATSYMPSHSMENENWRGNNLTLKSKDIVLK